MSSNMRPQIPDPDSEISISKSHIEFGLKLSVFILLKENWVKQFLKFDYSVFPFLYYILL